MGLAVAIQSKAWINRLDALAPVLNRIAPPHRWAARETVLRAVDRISKNFSKDIAEADKDAEIIFGGDTSVVVDLIKRWHEGETPSLAALCIYALENWNLDLPESYITGILIACVLGEVENPLPYHNNLHFKKVLLQLIRLIEAQDNFNAKDIALMLMAACIHDLGHDGQGNDSELGRLERRSFEIAEVYFKEAGFADPRGLEAIHLMLICTDVTPLNDPKNAMNQMKTAYRFHFMAQNKEKLREDLKALENDSELALMALTLHEADVATSAGLDYGITKYETALYRSEMGDRPQAAHIVDFLDNVCQREMLSDAARRLYQENMNRILEQAEKEAG